MRSTLGALVALAAAASAGVSATPLNIGATSKSPFYVPPKWPTVPFAVPESWAGSLPVKPAHFTNQTYDYFFWYFESEQSYGKDDLVIWLNGGPGCSSLEGLLQENGPVVFPWNVTGEEKQPYVKLNPYSWTKVANVLWVEQPVPTGFSKGEPDANDEKDVAKEFYSFLLKFYDTFPESRGRRLWITGESYAGMYIPYIAHHIHHAVHHNEKHGVDLKGIQIHDPSWTNDFFGSEAAMPTFVRKWESLLDLPSSWLDAWYARTKKNSLYNYVEENLVYPPPAEGLKVPYSNASYSPASDLYDAATEANVNFNIYNVNQSHLTLDPLGFPPADSEANTTNIINDIPGFKKLIHAPEDVQWIECTNTFPFPQGDGSRPPDETVMPSVIAKNLRTTIAHGTLDAILLANGSALAIQNLTWGGQRGFHTKPNGTLDVNGTNQGTWHTERGLTFAQVLHSGHMIPQDNPPAALKLINYTVHGAPLGA